MRRDLKPIFVELIDSANAVIERAAFSAYKGIGWSPVVVLGHLVDVDEQVWQVRIDLMINAFRARESIPQFSWWEPNPVNTQLKYQERELGVIGTQFLSERSKLVKYLGSLETTDWNATARHATFGILDLNGFLDQLLIHDREHLVSFG